MRKDQTPMLCAAIVALAFTFKAPSIVVQRPQPTVQESVWCSAFGWGVWQWGLCPSWIPIPKKLQPIIQPDVPTCDIYGPCQEAKRK